MLVRKQQESILNSLNPNYVVVLFGARRTGKTVLMEAVKNILADKKILSVVGEDLEVAEILSSQKLGILQRFVKGYDYLFIDEAQTIPDIGKSLKLIVDNIPGIAVFITGSSAFNIKNQTGEPLTGRSRFLNLYPLAQCELMEDLLQMRRNLPEHLIYGTYPQVITSDTLPQKQEVLQSIKNGYLLKDILVLDNLKDSLFVLDLLRLIAFQIGNDISYSELAVKLGVNTRTVQRYLDLLEKTFVLFSHRGFSRNLRKEISKSPRYYFWDNGIRNTVIANYNDFKTRDDVGQLWENYCVVERTKYLHYHQIYANSYFWRTYDQQEIDLLEEREGRLFAYEFKYANKKVKTPSAFSNAYNKFDFQTIHQDNYYEFIGV